jgi:hypothetical protein
MNVKLGLHIEGIKEAGVFENRMLRKYLGLR